MRPDIAGWSSLVARRAHNPEVVGSNPAPATKNLQLVGYAGELFLLLSDCEPTIFRLYLGHARHGRRANRRWHDAQGSPQAVCCCGCRLGAPSDYPEIDYSFLPFERRRRRVFIGNSAPTIGNPTSTMGNPAPTMGNLSSGAGIHRGRSNPPSRREDRLRPPSFALQ